MAKGQTGVTLVSQFTVLNLLSGLNIQEGVGRHSTKVKAFVWWLPGLPAQVNIY